MINPSELRIGNRVLVTFSEDEVGFGKGNGCISDISSIKRNKVQIDEDHHWHPIDMVAPIKLTGDILKDYGFVSVKRSYNLGISGFHPISYWYIIDGIDMYTQSIIKYHFILSEFKDGFYYQGNIWDKKGIKIKHVHQFQNLYFSITGEELIK